MRGSVAACVLLALASCRAAPPPVEEVLATPLPANARGEAPLPVAVDRARAARAAASANPENLDDQREATRALFTVADLRMWTAALALLDETPPSTVEDVLDVEDRLDGETTDAVRSLCTEGLAAADRALALAPDDAVALQYRALHLSLLAWAEGPAQAVLSGRGTKIAGAISRAVAADPMTESAAPLRLAGRFRTRAPWPLRDLDAARADLERAVAAFPVPVHHLFLGDVLEAEGERAAARAAWARAVEAEDDPFTPLTNDIYRELARWRVVAAAEEE